MADIIDGKCHSKKAPEEGLPLIQQGNLVIQAHHVGWLIASFFTLVSIVTSFWLINKHLQWYTRKQEQRYIVRILFMVPVYAMISLASYLFWDHATPLLLLRDCYESTVLTAFFYLLLVYLSPDEHEQKEIFRKGGLSRQRDDELRRRGQKPTKWVIPLGMVKWKPVDGLYFLQLMKWGVLQYCVIRPTTTLAAIILDYIGLYCEDSWSPGWGHIYISVIVSISVTIAMYCLVQLYVPVSENLKSHKPLLKLFAIKAVVFLTFWQATGLSLLTMFGLVKDTKYMTAENINIGIGALLETFEMMLFAFLHIKAFTYKPYHEPPHRTSRLRAFVHAFNFKETLRELWVGAVYMFRHARGKETDPHIRREVVLEGVFGKTRMQIAQDAEKAAQGREKDLAVDVEVDEVVHVGEERQWLGVGNDYGYGLGYHSRRTQEKSEGLEEQIEKELAKRGYNHKPSDKGVPYNLLQNPEMNQALHEDTGFRRHSWWRDIYTRLSQSAPEEYVETPSRRATTSQFADKRLSQREKRRSSRHIKGSHQETYDDVPPPSIIRHHKRNNSRRKSETPGSPSSTLDSPGSPQPMIGSTPLTPISHAPSSDLERAGGLLGYAFPALTDASTSAEVLSTGSMSPQSHRSKLRLGGEPAVIPSHAIVSYSPTVTTSNVWHPQHLSALPEVYLESNADRKRSLDQYDQHQGSFYRRDSAHYIPINPNLHKDLPPEPKSHILRERTIRATDNPSRKLPLQRDQIILATPLSPAANHQTPTSQSLMRDINASHTKEPAPMSRGVSTPPITFSPWEHHSIARESVLSPSASSTHHHRGSGNSFATLPPGLRRSSLPNGRRQSYNLPAPASVQTTSGRLPVRRKQPPVLVDRDILR